MNDPNQLALWETEGGAVEAAGVNPGEPPHLDSITLQLDLDGVMSIYWDSTTTSTQDRLDLLARLYDQARQQIYNQAPTN